MRLVLGISTVLGVIGVGAAFGLFYLAVRVFHLDRSHAQTMMYLKLSVAGHLTIFLTRTRGPFWSVRPARTLWIAVLGTQAVATLIAVYGLFMAPLGWGWAGFVWGYALVWFLVNDRIKLLAYRVFDRARAEPAAAVAANAGAHVAPKPAAKAAEAVDVTPQIASRAYALYEKEGRREGHAVQDWQEAEREIRPGKSEAEVKSDTTAAPAPETKPEPPQDAEAKGTPVVEPEPPAAVTAQLVERVHELYQELGREDVMAVEASDRAARTKGKDDAAHGDTPDANTEPKPGA